MPNNFTINSYCLPQWLRDWIYNFGGFRCHEIENLNNVMGTLLIYENSYLESPKQWQGLLANNTIGRLVVFNDHPFTFTDQVLTDINQSGVADRLRVFCQGHWQDREKYPNVISRHMDLHEHFFSHHTIFLLSRKLKQIRRPVKDFLWYTLPKDQYRKSFVDAFANDPLLSNSIVSFDKTNSRDMYVEAADRIEEFRKSYGDGEWINGLRCYGNGLPNMKAYEQAACELVLETANRGSWHLSEKFFRPVGFGVPVILLADREIYDQTQRYGYRFYDHANFYERFHSTADVEHRIQYLRGFMSHIKQQRPAAMQEIADYNYQIFWNQRKNAYYDTAMRYWKELIGNDNFLDDMYDRLDT